MTQKFPFDHFLKLDSFNDNRPAAKISEKETSPVIVEQAMKNLNPVQPAITPEFSNEELKTITDALLEHLKNLINPNKFHTYFANTFTVSGI